MISIIFLLILSFITQILCEKPDCPYIKKLFEQNNITDLYNGETDCCHFKGISCDDDDVYVTNIILQDKRVTTITEGISKLAHLYQFVSILGKIEEIPVELYKCPHLGEVDLGDNQIKTFPDGIKQLQTLEKLRLTNNQLKSLPKDIFTIPSLTYLEVTQNEPLRFQVKKEKNQYVPEGFRFDDASVTCFDDDTFTNQSISYQEKLVNLRNNYNVGYCTENKTSKNTVEPISSNVIPKSNSTNIDINSNEINNNTDNLLLNNTINYNNTLLSPTQNLTQATQTTLSNSILVDNNSNYNNNSNNFINNNKNTKSSGASNLLSSRYLYILVAFISVLVVFSIVIRYQYRNSVYEKDLDDLNNRMIKNNSIIDNGVNIDINSYYEKNIFENNISNWNKNEKIDINGNDNNNDNNNNIKSLPPTYLENTILASVNNRVLQNRIIQLLRSDREAYNNIRNSIGPNTDSLPPTYLENAVLSNIKNPALRNRIIQLIRSDNYDDILPEYTEGDNNNNNNSIETFEKHY
ncbi:hypothetical protein BCR32DRAFT_291616 [Anaeromyces robustus]|uniref:L domain-like protein n=1 Tax=Anaeromyces robustus TaxID=1754192 RepID=A0A1Y1XE26_9FUNG|nr:hypothetical protein BCR32DRAFT_291616 [Anaeromyces robustus]|eukprot:ORX84031.1 hypothetical protein BCR32DRAFT_291616 [Anaeromyces robustus]